MIFNGFTGFISGSLNVPAGTVLRQIRGPVAGWNYFNTTTEPFYQINITPGATGTVALQGTNDIAYTSDDGAMVTVQADLLPTDGATWTNIQAATSVSASGMFSTSYQFLQLIVVSQGSGTIINAFVQWN